MNNLFEIKVCGINDKKSMNTALKCKVNYIGFVFYPNSPRNISINQSRELLQSRNKNTKIVALTVDPNDDFLFNLLYLLNMYGGISPNDVPKVQKNISTHTFFIIVSEVSFY